MSDRKQSASSKPAIRDAPPSGTASSPVASSTYDTSGRERNEAGLPHSRDQGGQEATQRIEGKKHGQKGQREEIVKEEEGKRQIAARTNNKPAPAAGGVGGPMGTEEGRKEDRLKGKL